MPRRRLPWILLFLWAAWLFALQGLAASSAGLGPWTPELGLVLLLALDGRVSPGRTRLAACLIAGARIAFSADPPLAVLAGYLGAVGFSGALREILDVDRGLARALLAGVLTLLLVGFWNLSRTLELAAEGLFAPAPGLAWRTAATTAIATLCLAPLLLRLPGITPLWRRAR